MENRSLGYTWEHFPGNTWAQNLELPVLFELLPVLYLYSTPKTSDVIYVPRPLFTQKGASRLQTGSGRLDLVHLHLV